MSLEEMQGAVLSGMMKRDKGVEDEGKKQEVKGKKEGGRKDEEETRREGYKDVAMGLEDGKNTEGSGLGDSKHAVQGKRRRVGSWNTKEGTQGEMDTVEGEDDLGIEAGYSRGWREGISKERERKKKEGEERRLRGEERGWKKEEVETVYRRWRDWREKVDDVEEILGIEKEEALWFTGYIDRRKMKEYTRRMEDVMEVIGERLREGKGFEKGKKETGEERRDEEEGLWKEKGLEKRKAVEEGRNYKEVAMEGRKKWDEVEKKELEEKKEKEREKEYKTKGERETRVGNVMEVVMESQNEEGEVEGKWEKRELERELNLKEGTILEVKGRGNRLRIKVEEKEDLEELAEVKKEEWEKVVKKKVVSAKRVDQ
ncbi:hypothetical protein HOY82DRAFT_615909 [Tuber indicum]|nr:hypothetical protein HOY82DRAFT_615909 [Tuber indicum]